MEQREKLIELIKQSDWFAVEFDSSGEASFAINFGKIADYLIANRVVVLPCRCGECEHWSRNTGHCWITQDGMLNTDFCSYAKRKGGDE